ncbi:MAG: mRNA surveillance protein pelota [Candidatus Lokiarchaeota archaeon]|nr:mRNA surveillance protein pelota [Candidatus Lokiarchaeota archaeon]
MQIIFQDRNKGIIKLLTQNLDDLWTLYNIIKPNDLVKSRTHRRIVFREGDKGERKPMTLEIKTESVEFHEYSNRLRIKGRITEGPDEYISLGQYHTLNIEVGTKLSIKKNAWYKHDLRRLKKSTDSFANKKIVVIAVESGLATIGIISNYSVRILSTIRHNIPGKRFANQNSNKALEVFFNKINTLIIDKIKQLEINLVIIIGPGFLKEKYQTSLKENLIKDNLEMDTRLLSASSGTDSAIYEVLRSGEISKIISNHKISLETGYMEEFVARLGKDYGLATYGFDQCLKAAEMGSVERLLITDILLRTVNTDQEKHMEQLFNLVEQNGGEVHILSTRSPAGEQLDKFGGIAALLRFRI